MNPTATSPYGHDGVVERTAEGGVIHFERELPYSVDEVWDAVTRPERLAEWWLPFDANISIDLRPGGQMTFEGVGDEPVAMTCEILKVDPPRLLEHTHVDNAFMRWELDPTAEGCRLRLSHFVSDVPNAIESCYVVGLHASLSRLAPCLAGQPIEWDWEQFAVDQAAYATLGFAPAPPAHEAEPAS